MANFSLSNNLLLERVVGRPTHACAGCEGMALCGVASGKNTHVATAFPTFGVSLAIGVFTVVLVHGGLRSFSVDPYALSA